MKPRFPVPTLVLSIILGIFMVGTGAMTFLMQETIATTEPDPGTRALYQALFATGYMFSWIGIYKIINGILLFIPQTRALGVIGAFPYYVNIMLYCFFVAPHYMPLGAAALLVNLYLIRAYYDFWKPLIGKNTGPAQA